MHNNIINNLCFTLLIRANNITVNLNFIRRPMSFLRVLFKNSYLSKAH